VVLAEIAEAEDIEAALKSHPSGLTKIVSILNDAVNMWTRALRELLDNLAETIPKEGMIGEVHYWRDINRVLDAVSSELKQPQVEVAVQILLEHGSKNQRVVDDVTDFTK
jgi:hypothetical protein